MRLDGVHHVTCITGDAPRNVDFYTRVLGLRLVKKTVNQDDPTVYHLFYADEQGSPGSDITFFEYPGIERGRAGDGMVHTVRWRVGSEAALDFWAERLADEADAVARERRHGLRSRTRRACATSWPRSRRTIAPLVAKHPEIPPEHALQGFDGVRAYAGEPERSRALLEETLGFEPKGDCAWETRGDSRGGLYAYDQPPPDRGQPGAGTVHHVAWASTMEEHEAWHRAVTDAGRRPSPIIDRFWFRSIYFREPSGVLFELATLGPGFAVDEDPEHLGEKLVLPPAFEHLREQIEPVLTPLPDPRAASRPA